MHHSDGTTAYRRFVPARRRSHRVRRQRRPLRTLPRTPLPARLGASGSSILSALKDSEPGVCSATPSSVVDLSTATTERCDFPLHAELGHRGYGHVGCVGCVSRTLAQ